MAIRIFEDYAFCPLGGLFTYVTSHMPKQFVGTENYLFAFPASANPEDRKQDSFRSQRSDSTRSTQRWCEGAVNELAQAREITLIHFETTLVAWADSTPGALAIELREQCRFEIRTSLFMKGIYWSTREDGAAWSGYSVPQKSLLLQWEKFYRRHPLSI